MSGTSTGLSALTASQRMLDVIGQNIANANTPGYHRQVADLRPRDSVEQFGMAIGSGVDVVQIRRLRDSLLERSFTSHSSQVSETTAQLSVLRQVETLLSPGANSVHDLLEGFFNQLEQLSAQPANLALRRVMIGSATALSNGLNSLGSDLDQLRESLDAHLAQDVIEINRLTSQISELNGAVARSEVRGVPANDLRDQRDELINQLAGFVAIQTVEQNFGQVNVLAGGQGLVLDNRAIQLRVSTDKTGMLTVGADGAPPLALIGGKVAGLLQVRNKTLPDYRARLDALAHELIRSIDTTHATGLGLSGSFSFLSGARAVRDATVPLTQSGLAFPAQAGSVFVSVTELATGKRTLSEVVIDPATQSLQSVAAAFSGIAHVQGLVDGQTGTLKVIAQPGYTFDFAPRLATAPDSAAITGSTTPAIGGRYTGTNNEAFTFRVLGTGTIGVTPNLTLRVEDATGSVVASLNIGNGYEPGSELQVGNGVTVRLTSGTANDGDAFTVRAVAQADTAGILTALGLNTFFRGDNASNIAVQADIVADPSRFAASRTGQPGDGSNVQNLAAQRDAALLANGTQTLSQAYASLIGEVGSRVQDLSQRETSQQLLGQRLEAERQSVSGVDPNEELLHMIQAQRAFQAAAHYLDVVNKSLDELFRII